MNSIFSRQSNRLAAQGSSNFSYKAVLNGNARKTTGLEKQDSFFGELSTEQNNNDNKRLTKVPSIIGKRVNEESSKTLPSLVESNKKLVKQESILS